MRRNIWNTRPARWTRFDAVGPGREAIPADSHILVVAVRGRRPGAILRALDPGARLRLALAAREADGSAFGWPTALAGAFVPALEDEILRSGLRTLTEDEVVPLDPDDELAPTRQDDADRQPSSSREEDDARSFDRAGVRGRDGRGRDGARRDRRREASYGRVASGGERPAATRVPRFRQLFADPGLKRIVMLATFPATFKTVSRIPRRNGVRASPAARNAPLTMKKISIPRLPTNMMRRNGSASTRTAGAACTTSSSDGDRIQPRGASSNPQSASAARNAW